MSEGPRYVRVYYSIIDDERFVEIIDDVSLLGTWLRLLMIAESVWPASADLPRWVKPRLLSALTKAGIVETSGHRYRIHGLDAERNARAAAARVGGLASGRSRAQGSVVEQSSNGRSADVQPTVNLKEKRIKEKINDQGRSFNGPPADGDPPDLLDRYHDLTGYRPWGIWSGEALHALINDYGNDVATAALDAEWSANPERKQLIDRVASRLAKDADRKRQTAMKTPRKPKPPVDEAARIAIVKEWSELTP